MSIISKANPVDSDRQDALFGKVWRNWNTWGNSYCTIDIGRTYKDKVTGQLRESNKLQPEDFAVLERRIVPKLYAGIDQTRDADRIARRKQVPQQEQGQASQPAYSEQQQAQGT